MGILKAVMVDEHFLEQSLELRRFIQKKVAEKDYYAGRRHDIIRELAVYTKDTCWVVADEKYPLLKRVGVITQTLLEDPKRQLYTTELTEERTRQLISEVYRNLAKEQELAQNVTTVERPAANKTEIIRIGKITNIDGREIKPHTEVNIFLQNAM